MKIWIDGNIKDESEAVISVFDHGLLYGDGIFEGIRIYGGNVFKLDEHLDRLYEGARAISLTVPYSQDELAKFTRETVAAEGSDEGYIRLVVTRGCGTLGVSPVRCPKASVIIIVGGIQLYPEEFYRKGISLITASIRRSTVTNVDERIKSLNYLPNVMASLEAHNSGCQEALILNQDGFVAECSADNIFRVRKGRLETPPISSGALDGITRRTVLELAGKLGIPSEEKLLTCYDFYTADECFLTGTGAELVPVARIDGRSIGTGEPGPLTGMLAEAYGQLVRGK